MLDLKNILQSMGASENKEIAFRPVRCSEKQLSGKTAVDGFVYFTTDSKKIYCGVGENFVPMGGNSGIYYGTRTFTEDETGTTQTDFVFLPGHIDGGELPQLNDLILNSDGCFYRVVSLNENQCVGRRLTVAGSGGGPAGPGGNTGGSSAPSLVDQYNGATVYFNVNKPDTMKMYFKATSLVPENNYIRKLRIIIGANEIIEDNLSHQFDRDIEFDLNKYIKYFLCGIAIVSSTFIGIFLIKSIVEMYLYSQPFLLRASNNIFAFIADVVVLLFAVPFCEMLDPKIRKFIDGNK